MSLWAFIGAWAGFSSCTGGETPGQVELSQLTLSLVTPAEVDPWNGADAIGVIVTDANGVTVAEAEGPVNAGLNLPDIASFGLVNVAVVAKAGDEVVAAGRTGLILVDERDQQLQVLFLPVNQAVPLDYEPLADRVDHVAWIAPDGRLLLLGGRGPSGGEAVSTTEWFDPLTGFATGPFRLPAAVYGMEATEFGAHELLVAGGRYAAFPEEERAMESFTVSADGSTLTELPDLVRGRDEHCLAAFQQGSAVAIGGRGADIDRTLEVLRPGSGGGRSSWSELLMDDLVTSDVTGCVATEGGYVVTAGTSPAGFGVLDLAEASNGDIPGAFERVDADVELTGAILVPLPDDQVLMLGGFDGSAARFDGHVIDAPAANIHETVGMANRRGWASWGWWSPSVIAIGGGYSDAAQVQSVQSLEFLDVDEGPLLELPVPLNGAEMTIGHDGAVLFTGGTTNGGAGAGAWAVVPWIP